MIASVIAPFESLFSFTQLPFNISETPSSPDQICPVLVITRLPWQPAVLSLHWVQTSLPWSSPTLTYRWGGGAALRDPDSTVHGAHLVPTGPRWAPCWPHELCYLGWDISVATSMVLCFNSFMISSFVFQKFQYQWYHVSVVSITMVSCFKISGYMFQKFQHQWFHVSIVSLSVAS